MTTSGTVATTTVLLSDMLDSAIRRCKMSTSDLTPEHVEIARGALHAWLSSLANRGIQYWAVERTILGLRYGKSRLALPAGTIDVLNANRRSLDYPSGGSASSDSGGTAANAFDRSLDTVCTQTSTDGAIKYDFGTEVLVTTIGIVTNGSATLNVVWEASADDSTWETLYAPGSVAYSDQVWAWADIETPLKRRYYRVRETGGGTLDVRQVVFGRNPQEIPLAEISRDVYAGLSNPNAVGTPVQYWYDRKRSQPEMRLWNTPDDPFDCIVVYRSRQIQDVVALTQEIEIPQHWLEAVRWQLAFQVASEMPDVPQERELYLKQMADLALMGAEDGETGGGDMMLTPNIGAYTQ